MRPELTVVPVVKKGLHKDVTVDVELFNMSKPNPIPTEKPIPVKRCILRITQVNPEDSRSDVYRLRDLLQNWLQIQDLHVANLLEAQDMIFAMRQGLQPRLELPPRRSRDDIF